jgi:hypothetical protein
LSGQFPLLPCGVETPHFGQNPVILGRRKRGTHQWKEHFLLLMEVAYQNLIEPSGMPDEMIGVLRQHALTKPINQKTLPVVFKDHATEPRIILLVLIPQQRRKQHTFFFSLMESISITSQESENSFDVVLIQVLPLLGAGCHIQKDVQCAPYLTMFFTQQIR